MKFNVPIWLTVDAETSDAAFAFVRSHFAVVEDKQRTMILNQATSVDFDVEEPVAL